MATHVRRSATRTLLALVAAASVLVTPLRLWGECPMIDAQASVADLAAGAADAHDAHSGHDGHNDQHVHGPAAAATEQPEGSRAPSHEVCLDLTHCAVAVPAIEVVHLVAAGPPAGEDGSTVPLAYSTAARTLEPPPPKQR